MTLSRMSLLTVTVTAALAIPATRSYASGTRYFHITGCNAAQNVNAAGTPTGPLAGGPNVLFNPSTSQLQNTSANGLVIYCPLHRDSQVNIPAPSGPTNPVIVSLFYNGTGSKTFTRVCRTFGAPGGGTGTSCGGVVVPVGGPQIYELQAGVSGGGTNDFYYAVVGLGPITGSLTNQFFGYRITNN